MSALVVRLAAITLAACWAGSAVGQGYRYEVIPLGQKYGIELDDINELGEITGLHQSAPASAYVLDKSGLTVLPRLPGTTSNWGVKINSSGDVLGDSVFGVLNKAVLWVDGKPIDLGMVRSETGGDWANDLNDSLQVSALVNGRPAIWEKGTVSFLDLPPEYLFGSATGINNSGDCSGSAFTTDSRAVRWVDGVFESLHPAGYSGSNAYEIAENGDIGGEVTRPGVQSVAFWRGGTEFFELGGLTPGGFSYFNDLNSMSQVVGLSSEGGHFRGFLWENGEMLSLTDLVETGWTIGNAHAINDRGQILAGGNSPTGQGQTVLLNPVPEPSTGVLLALAVFCLCILRRPRSVAASTDRLR